MTTTWPSESPVTGASLGQPREIEPHGELDRRTNYADDLVPRFQAFLQRAVPRDAEVLIVSKGDRALVEVQGRRAGHFPQRGDGVYAGYYPRTSAAAIEHLEALRENGAEFLAFPITALWWLDHYEEFARHLGSRYRLIARGDSAGALYALFTPGQGRGSDRARVEPEHPCRPDSAEVPRVEPTRPLPAPNPLARLLDDRYADDVRALFDPTHYAAQAGATAGNGDAALAHYLREGYLRGFSPHPLFDVRWYVRHHLDAVSQGMNPLLHFVRFAAERQLDPNPYFDTGYYLEQAGGPDRLREIPVVHYLRRAAANESYHPNPLFRDGFYLRTYRDLEGVQTPLEHFLQIGWREGRAVSDVHREMNVELGRSSRSGITRGNWTIGTVLVFAAGHPRPDRAGAVRLADDLAKRFHIDSPVVAVSRADVADRMPAAARLLVLEDFQLAAEVHRPSAQRLFVKALVGSAPMFAISEALEPLEVLADHSVGTYFLLPTGPEQMDRERLAGAFAHATRVIAPSSQAFAGAAAELGTSPANVALRDPGADGYAEALLELGERDFGLSPSLRVPRRASGLESVRRIVIPCSDWSVSGVNASLEALGQELTRRGWEVEILFTRDAGWVRDSAHGGTHMPTLPYRFLERRRVGIEGLWEALLTDLETRAPTLVLSSYDFLANGVISALTDHVGVVMWVQADDGDYYEQAYRLGRYCDAVVCVSQAIRQKIVALNPALADRAHVIPNSSVQEQDIVERLPEPAERLRLVYSGRLVQYQKRVLDYVDLARSLDGTGVPYEIVLVGSFPQHGDVRERFHEAAAEQLASGRIRLAGRLSRSEILAELDAADVFVLLSEFEGLPLALVEAMARGCVPVAAAMDSGIPEIVSDGVNGLIVSGRDYDSWARRIVELFRDRGRLERMSERARTTVRESFTVEQAANRFEEIFDSVGRDAVAGTARRPPALHWGHERSRTGDVLPPPSIVRPEAVSIGGLRRWR